jgi:serine/threonine protein kinase
MASIDEAGEKRRQFLQELFEQTGGGTFNHIADMYEVGKKIGCDTSQTEKIGQLLEDERLVELVGRPNMIRMLPRGRLEVEHTLSNSLQQASPDVGGRMPPVPRSTGKVLEFETAFARYTTLTSDIVGEGGTARVYRATDEAGNKYAIKLLDSAKATREKLKRFKNEILFGSTNRHAHLVCIIDSGLFYDGDKKSPFYVMTLYDGSLRDLIKGTIAQNKVLNYFSQLLNGVEAAHLHRVVHRDLKPENILHHAKSDQLGVADFGIARFGEEELYTLVETAPNSRLANFQYAAPEQRSRGAAVDQKADIYALGLMLNEMFTQEIPQGTNYKTIASVASEYAYLDEMVASMLEQFPANRPASIDHIKQQLIGRKNDFVTRQRLSQLRQTVIPQGEIDDPLILDPIRLVSVDYEKGYLIVRFNQPVTDKWRQALTNMGGFSAIWGKSPENFSFTGDMLRISARENEVQKIINYFKKWLPKANRNYQEMIANEQRLEEERQRQQLQAEIDEVERRQRILQNVRI